MHLRDGKPVRVGERAAVRTLLELTMNLILQARGEREELAPARVENVLVCRRPLAVYSQ